MLHVFYLHGFASSPRSSKAAALARRLNEHGLPLHTPDFNEPEFSTLTVTRMIDQVGRDIDALPAAPVALVGSSLGAFVAVQVACARPSQVSRLVLLAPALDFGASTISGSSGATVGGDRMRGLGGQGLDEWRRTNRLDIFHYGYGRTMSVQYSLYADACGYDCLGATLSMPAQVFQGTRDDVVDPEMVRHWAASRPNVELHLLDDDHQLTASIEYIWREMKRFLGLSTVG
jgi:pimeloyl-ACP methyl ester carboxylesterase